MASVQDLGRGRGGGELRYRQFGDKGAEARAEVLRFFSENGWLFGSALGLIPNER